MDDRRLSPLSKTYHGKKEFIDKVIGPFNTRMAKPLVPTIRGLCADGDTVIILFDAAATARDGVLTETVSTDRHTTPGLQQVTRWGHFRAHAPQ